MECLHEDTADGIRIVMRIEDDAGPFDPLVVPIQHNVLTLRFVLGR